MGLIDDRALQRGNVRFDWKSDAPQYRFS